MLNEALLDAPKSSALKILVADDAGSDLLILSSILKNAGHNVVLVDNGTQAVAAYKIHKPDMVILDVLMPEMNGYEAARSIKKLAGDEFVPIIFLTSLTDTSSLVQGLDAGGDDFLSKPYNSVILTSKITAFNRMRSLQKTVVKQKNLIQQHNERLLHEQTVAKHVFDKIAHTGCLDSSNVRYSLSPLAIFNGDIVVASVRPNGNMMMLLGDFTGHGLPAAIGAIPLASTFYAMAPKGFGMSDILLEVNRKLKDILPVGNFCCAILIEINFKKKLLHYWNGGLPDAVVFDTDNGDLRHLHSRHLPLAILGNRSLNTTIETLELRASDKIYLWTDGIHEARNSEEEMFGNKALWDIFDLYKPTDNIFDLIIAGVQQFSGEDKDDDVSLIEISLDNVPVKVEGPKLLGSSTYDSSWHAEFFVDHTSFSTVNPLPIVVNGLMGVSNLRNHQSSLYAIISELYANALDHGILQLDSAMKRSGESFQEYYRLKEERLHNIKDGFISIKMDVSIRGTLGELKFTLEDSGNGFDYENFLNGRESVSQVSINEYSGRGIMMVREICKSLEFLGKGNKVIATFCWSTED